MVLVDYVRMTTEERAFTDICADMMRSGMRYDHAYRWAYRIAYRSHYRMARRPLGVALALSCILGGAS